MLAIKIDDHVAAALRRRMQQYKGMPNLEAILVALVQQIQDLEDAIYPLNEGRQLYNGTTYPAIGAQLDGIGALVGLARNGLTDPVYLIFIIGTIAANFSQTTLPEIQTIVALLFNPTQKLTFEMFPAEVNIEVAGSTLDPSLYETAARLIQRALGAAIRLGFVAEFDLDRPFRFSSITRDPSPGNFGGFSSVADPTDGGKYAGLIYHG